MADTFLESNELLADFMGFEGQHENWCGNNILYKETLWDEEYMIPYNVHEDWSHLMKIVNKIKNMGFVFKFYYGEKAQCFIYNDNIQDISNSIVQYSGGTSDTLIECIYKACLAFVKDRLVLIPRDHQ